MAYANSLRIQAMQAEQEMKMKAAWQAGWVKPVEATWFGMTSQPADATDTLPPGLAERMDAVMASVMGTMGHTNRLPKFQAITGAVEGGSPGLLDGEPGLWISGRHRELVQLALRKLGIDKKPENGGARPDPDYDAAFSKWEASNFDNGVRSKLWEQYAADYPDEDKKYSYDRFKKAMNDRRRKAVRNHT